LPLQEVARGDVNLLVRPKLGECEEPGDLTSGLVVRSRSADVLIVSNATGGG